MSANDIWVFGYGSLVWQPGFECCHQEIARLDHYARSFCMWSVHYRGTPEHRGLVLALDKSPGTYCDGVAFRVEEAQAEAVMAYLRKRELVSDAYLEIETDIRLHSGKTVRAYTYVVDPNHDQYACDLSLDQQADIISTAVGRVGPNTDYLFNVAKHLRDWGVEDTQLDALAAKTRALISD